MRQFFKQLWHDLFGHPVLEIGLTYARCHGCRSVYAINGDGLQTLNAQRAAHIFELSEAEL